MAAVNVYLNFDGNCEEAFNFYKSVFGGEFPYIGRFNEIPPSEENPMSPEDGNRIMHVSLPIGDGSTMLLGSDTGGEWAQYFKQGNNFSISVTADSTDEAKRIFDALAAGGKVTMPLAKTFWADSFGMLEDKFGVNWMMSYSESKGPM